MDKPLFPRILFGVLASGLIILSACSHKDGDDAKNDILSANIDTTVNPGDDFFNYACGTWIKNNPIPASESGWGIGKLVQNEIYARLLSLSENAAKTKAETGSDQQKIGDFFATAMDSTTQDKQGIAPLKAELDKIDAIKDTKQLMNVAAQLNNYNVGVMVGIGAQQDMKNSDVIALYLWQGGLGLPNRDYYFNTDARTVNIRKEYITHVTNIYKLMGADDATAKKSADNVMKLETSLAKASRKLEQLRDPYANYNKMAIGDLKKLADIDWKEWLTQMNVKNIDSVIVGQPEFVKELGNLIKTTPIDAWKAYLKWHLVTSFADNIGKRFDDENFHFYGTVLQGKTQQRPRWKRVLDDEEASLGELLGKLFVKDYFSETAKKRYETMVDNVVEAFREHVNKLDWMSDSTKQVALNKLSKMNKKVGFPDKWKDLSGLKIDRSSYVSNSMNVARFWHDYNINKLGKPVDRTEWDMTPQTYNAYYNPSNNEIVLPAAIFAIPGVKDEDADDATVYGYGGASTIGHELTHGFDDEGRQFDEKGNLRNWWKKADEENFSKKVNAIVKQFSSYVVLDSMHVNGRATAGENIADLGGVVIAFDAFKKTEQYKKNEKKAGLTPTQRYFLGYSLGWLGHQRDEKLAQQILTDVHAPANLRVNGPFANLPEFYEAFNVTEGQKMWRADSTRVKIW